MLIAEKFIHSLLEKYGKHTVYKDNRTWYNEEVCMQFTEVETLSTSLKRKF
jgi:hypothetical protein